MVVGVDVGTGVGVDVGVIVGVDVGMIVGGGVTVGMSAGTGDWAGVDWTSLSQPTATKANDTRQITCTMRLTVMIYLLSFSRDHPNWNRADGDGPRCYRRSMSKPLSPAAIIVANLVRASAAATKRYLG